MQNSVPRLILASTSPYRQALLRKLGLPFESLPPEIDETRLPYEQAHELATRLAREKSLAIARHCNDAWVIGSDQVAVLDNRIIGKPGSRDVAISQLMQASGRTVEFHTAVCVTQADTLISRGLIDVCRATFRPLSRERIERYVDADQPYDCAGSFKSEGLGITLLERIVGNDPNALVGLPLIHLISLLDSFGLRIP